MKVTICHPGTQHSHYLAKQLYKQGCLLKFHTGIAFGDDHIINVIIKLLPQNIKKRIKTRIIDGLPDRKIKRNIFNEIIALYKLTIGYDQEETFFYRNKNFQKSLNEKDLIVADVVIGYDTSSWLIAEKCKNLGITFILDVTIGHPNSKNLIFTNLSKKYPNWENQLQIKNETLISYEQKENELASLIVTPSNFVKDTYIENGISSNKITVVPFGTDTSFFKFQQKEAKQKIKFLFFGSLNTRKGLPLLLSVWEKSNFKTSELTIAGFGNLPKNLKLPKNVTNKGKIAPEDRQKLFENHDVFVFPSNFEGFAQVQIEAAASGLPIISTINAGSQELVKNEFNGIVITAESEQELKEAITFFIDNKEKISEMSINQKEVIANFSWDAYGERWIKLLNDIHSKKC